MCVGLTFVMGTLKSAVRAPPHRSDPDAGTVTTRLRDKLQLPVAQTIYSISLTSKSCCWADGNIVRAYGGESDVAAYWSDLPSFEVLCGAVLLSNRSEEQTVCMPALFNPPLPTLSLPPPVSLARTSPSAPSLRTPSAPTSCLLCHLLSRSRFVNPLSSQGRFPMCALVTPPT